MKKWQFIHVFIGLFVIICCNNDDKQINNFKKISIYILIALIQHFSINKLRSLQLAYSNLVTRFISLFLKFTKWSAFKK